MSDFLNQDNNKIKILEKIYELLDDNIPDADKADKDFEPLMNSVSELITSANLAAEQAKQAADAAAAEQAKNQQNKDKDNMIKLFIKFYRKIFFISFRKIRNS